MKKYLKIFINSLLLSSYSISIYAENSYTFQKIQAIPDVVDIAGGVSLFEQNQEKLLGEKVYREINHHMPLIENVWLEDSLMSIFVKIFSQSQLGQPIALFLINNEQINAFAVPGGVFAINLGLILSAKHMGDIASVIAHEVAHVSQRHYHHSQEAFKGQGTLALLGILAGAIIASQSADAGAAVMLGTQAALLDKQLSYSRDQEREADRIGMQYLYSAGYDPHAMADFFETLQRKNPKIGDLPEFWLTHPLTSERISEARLRANQYPKLKYNIQYQDEEFKLIQYYTAVLSKKISEVELIGLSNQNNQPAKLALMLYYVQKNEWQKADNIQVNQEYQQHIVYHLLKADILISKKQYAKAEQFIRKKWNIMPENRALTYKLAEISILQKQGEHAQALIMPFHRQNLRDIHALKLLQQAIDNNSQLSAQLKTILLLQYRAEEEFWTGQEEQAIKSLLHAQRLSKQIHNESLNTQIESRIKKMQDERKIKF